MFKKILTHFFPMTFYKAYCNISILLANYGQWKSFKFNKSINANGEEIPWYTYPALEYLSSLNFKESVVLEFGSGASSTWWASRAKSVLAIEHDKNWYEVVKNRLSENLNIVLAESKEDYLTAADGITFDVIIIDGNYRYECAKTLKGLLNSSSLVILDNSDWHPKTAELLRKEYGFLQVDMHGFGPINNYTWTTSLFFNRDFSSVPLGKTLPVHSCGAILQTAFEDC